MKLQIFGLGRKNHTAHIHEKFWPGQMEAERKRASTCLLYIKQKSLILDKLISTVPVPWYFIMPLRWGGLIRVLPTKITSKRWRVSTWKVYFGNNQRMHMCAPQNQSPVSTMSTLAASYQVAGRVENYSEL